MTRIPTTPEAYAAFRAECLKADIEMDSAAHRREYRHNVSKEVLKQQQREYMRNWSRDHREEIRARANAKYAQKKAARLLEQSNGAVENNSI